MTKNFFLILFLIFLNNCSFHDATGFWSKQKKIKEEKSNLQALFEKKEIQEVEFNNNIKISANFNKINLNKDSIFNNNDGFITSIDKLENISRYNFPKIKNFKKIDANLISHNKNIIFFDNKGSIFCFDENKKLVWKNNIYTKEEKKIGPLIILHKKKDKLFAADNLGNYYSMNIDTGLLNWKKKHTSPFNSEIKAYKNRIYIVDSNNTLHSYLAENGTKVWSHITEKSFINSLKRLSIVIKDNTVIFNNSLGDITAVNARNGKLLWQTVTFNSRIYEDLMSLKTSDLIIDEQSIYFSNNKYEFYSLDIQTGLINWKQEISSNIKPTVIENLVFTVSNNGFQNIIEKKTGNIIKVNDIFYQFSSKKRNKIFPSGFVISSDYLYLSTSHGKLVIVDWKIGKVTNIMNIDGGLISRGFVNNQKIYIVKDNSIIELH